MLKIQPGCLDHIKAKKTLSVLLADDFFQHIPFHKATAYCMLHIAPATIAPQQVKTMEISITAQLTLIIKLIYTQ